ncbi:hypothetical protein M441DRAFT_49634 [Trichoderma asperellum CBS 433.97]|uniref:Uncharacterized protein n=1 Tax=Trichoderma asperellum (strain ATCC 204424 / CBS 433.97 / NBRC 101777) TaxID=1042311 RepID=A0A2T3Z044_TRIA4|nr:hypothetical protein M441DRAFT_49634 [Trichoderma asperellum CBS 433.97]PTB38167.1 hypothetical protein M441DRAFT_49634 [Trichoderma asperellum CBS 433.97]
MSAGRRAGPTFHAHCPGRIVRIQLRQRACFGRLDEKNEREEDWRYVSMAGQPYLANKTVKKGHPPALGSELYTTTHGNAADVDESGRERHEQRTVTFPLWNSKLMATLLVHIDSKMPSTWSFFSALPLLQNQRQNSLQEHIFVLCTPYSRLSVRLSLVFTAISQAKAGIQPVHPTAEPGSSHSPSRGISSSQ